MFLCYCLPNYNIQTDHLGILLKHTLMDQVWDVAQPAPSQRLCCWLMDHTFSIKNLENIWEQKLRFFGIQTQILRENNRCRTEHPSYKQQQKGKLSRILRSEACHFTPMEKFAGYNLGRCPTLMRFLKIHLPKQCTHHSKVLQQPSQPIHQYYSYPGHPALVM